jgi:hypothetical protein
MKGIITKLLNKLACGHKWKTYKEMQMYASNVKVSNKSEELPLFQLHTLICKECGKIKKIKV